MLSSDAVFQTKALANDLDSIRVQPNVCPGKAARYDGSVPQHCYTAHDDVNAPWQVISLAAVFFSCSAKEVYLLKYTPCGIARPDPITINISGG